MNDSKTRIYEKCDDSKFFIVNFLCHDAPSIDATVVNDITSDSHIGKLQLSLLKPNKITYRNTALSEREKTTFECTFILFIKVLLDKVFLIKVIF